MDVRKKACPNEKCENFKGKKYNSKMNYCPFCGEKLVFVCKSISCFKPIEDIGPKHTYCEECTAKQKDAKDSVVKEAKKIGAAVGAVVVAVGQKEIKEVVEKGFKIAKKVVIKN